MNYPFEFRELLLTSKLLDNMGFSEYWGDCGDSGTRVLTLGKSLYRIHEIDEKEDDCDGYCESRWYCPSVITNENFQNLYFLHEMYEDILDTIGIEAINIFTKICKNKNVSCYNYLQQYLDFKNKPR